MGAGSAYNTVNPKNRAKQKSAFDNQAKKATKTNKQLSI
jgi:hypothetical protein